MGVHIAYDDVNDVAVMYDSVTGTAFGPVIEHGGGIDRMQAFLDSLDADARGYTEAELRTAWGEWAKANPHDDE